MTDADATTDPNKRHIVLVTGLLESDGPFWCYVAVKPECYADFKTVYAQGDLNLYQFKKYGEIIFSGEGEMPPSDIMAMVANLYKLPAEQLYQAHTFNDMPGTS